MDALIEIMEKRLVHFLPLKWSTPITRQDWMRLAIFLFFFLFLILPLSGCRLAQSEDKLKVELQGYIEGELSYMAGPFAGNLKALSKQRGEPVKKGDILFVLESEPQNMQAMAAKEAIVQAQSRLQLAQIRLERMRELYQDKAIQKDALDAAIEERNTSEALLEESKQRSNESSWNLLQKTGIAPLNSIVYDTYFTQGEWVPVGMPVLSLLMPENIKIIFFVPEKMIHAVKLQEKIIVTVNNKQYQAKIEYISPQVEYTPPVIFSRENDAKLVFKVRAHPLLSQAYDFHPGEPVRVQFVEP